MDLENCEDQIKYFEETLNRSCCYTTRKDYYFEYVTHVVLCCLYIIVFIINAIGNLAVWLTVPFKKNLRSPMNYFLLNLSLTHFLSGIFTLLFCFTLDVGYYHTDQFRLKVLCSITEGLGFYFVTVGANVFTLCGIALNRFLAIQYPTRQELRMQKKFVIIFNICTWVVSLAGMVPGLISFRYEKHIRVCLREWSNINPMAYRLAFFFAAIIFPLSFVISSFLAIVWKRKGKHNQIFSGTVPTNRRTHLMRAERLLGVVILTFLIFWSPFFSYWGLYTVTTKFTSCEGEIEAMKWIRITVLIASMNSAVDPFIYIIGGSTLRNECKCLLRLIFHKIMCHSFNRVSPTPDIPVLADVRTP